MPPRPARPERRAQRRSDAPVGDRTAVQGGAASTVLKRFFGTDRIGFTTCSLTLPAGKTCTDPSPVTRSYASFSEAAKENGISRILVGFHFRKAVEEGIEHGGSIGDLAVDRFLRPVR